MVLGISAWSINHRRAAVLEPLVGGVIVFVNSAVPEDYFSFGRAYSHTICLHERRTSEDDNVLIFYDEAFDLEFPIVTGKGNLCLAIVVDWRQRKK